MNTETGQIFSPEEIAAARQAQTDLGPLTPVSPWERAALEDVPEAERPARLTEMRREREEERAEKRAARLEPYAEMLEGRRRRLSLGIPVNRGRGRSLKRSQGREHQPKRPPKPAGKRAAGIVQVRYRVTDAGRRASLELRFRDADGDWNPAGRVNAVLTTAADRGPDGALSPSAVAKMAREARINLKRTFAPRGVELKPEPEGGEAWLTE